MSRFAGLVVLICFLIVGALGIGITVVADGVTELREYNEHVRAQELEERVQDQEYRKKLRSGVQQNRIETRRAERTIITYLRCEALLVEANMVSISNLNKCVREGFEAGRKDQQRDGGSFAAAHRSASAPPSSSNQRQPQQIVTRPRPSPKPDPKPSPKPPRPSPSPSSEDRVCVPTVDVCIDTPLMGLFHLLTV